MRIKNILLIITAITIVSCNGARKSETYRAISASAARSASIRYLPEDSTNR